MWSQVRARPVASVPCLIAPCDRLNPRGRPVTPVRFHAHVQTRPRLTLDNGVLQLIPQFKDSCFVERWREMAPSPTCYLMRIYAQIRDRPVVPFHHSVTP